MLNGPTTPLPQPLPGLTWKRFSLLRFRSPLLTESRLFSSPVGTEMFHFPTFPPHALCVQARVTPHDWCGVPPFGHPRINARLAAPRGLSQPPTSFIGSWCPGIHRVPLTTWPHNYNTPHPPHRRTPAPTPHRERTAGTEPVRRAGQSKKDARVHCAVLNDQPAIPPATAPAPTPTGTRRCAIRRTRTETTHPTRTRTFPSGPGGGPLPQDPTACLRPAPMTTTFPTRTRAGRTSSDPETTGRTGQRSTLEHHPGHAARHPCWAPGPDPGAALHHHTLTGTAARCSLERR